LINIMRGLWSLRDDYVVRSLDAARRRSVEVDALRAVCPGTRISDSVLLLGYRPGLFAAGDGAQIREGTVLAFGDDNNGFGRIEIGERSWLGQYNNLRAGGGDISIGRDCLVSQFCSIVATNDAHAPGRPIQSQGTDPRRRGISIGNDVWLGSGCAVMPGSSIGDGAIIGANAVVTSEVPANEIWAGVPARKIGIRR
jgi:acetyltransferase-like isoleucine patch superfamily enzyme